MRSLVLCFLLGAIGCGDPPWRETSQRLVLRAGSHSNGSLRIEADRDTLTSDQRALLARLERTTGGSRCQGDLAWIELRIEDADGSSAAYEANELGCPGRHELVDYGAAAELVASFGCRFASATRHARRGRDDALRFWPSRACHHGVFVGQEPDEVWMALEIAAPGAYRVTASGCEGWGVDASIFDSAGTALLAAGGPGSGGACAAAEYRFAMPGMAKIRLTKAGSRAGDLYVNLRRVD